MVLALVACWSSSPDPDLGAQRAAVEGFVVAKAALDNGQSAAARKGFANLPPVHPVIALWEARAAAEAGDLKGALAVLDDVIADLPEYGLARYNRAAYLARSGEIELAASDLEVALAMRATTLHEAMADPDFAPHLEHPALGFLVRNALIVAVEPPPPSTFLGSEVRLTLRVTGAGNQPLTVTSPQATGPVTLVEHTETLTQGAAGTGRTLVWAWRTDGPGTIVLDPLAVTAGPLTAETTGPRVLVAAPPERGDPTPKPLVFPVASVVGRDLAIGDARWAEGRLRIKVAAGDRLEREPPGPPPRRFTYREGGKVLWVVEEHEDRPSITNVTRTTRPGATTPVTVPARPSGTAPQ